jgi:hypothetical protein
VFLAPGACVAQPAFTLNAANLSYSGSGQTITVASDPAAVGGEWLKISSTAVGQWIQFTTPAIAAGVYQLTFTYRTNPTRAQDSMTIDGTLIGGTIDQYAPSPSTYPTVAVGTVTFSTAGAHVIRLTAIGKDAESTSYEISADAFTFTLQSGGGQAAAPTFSPVAGAYTNGQSAIISTATGNASLNYTTDGSTPTPTNGITYSGPVSVNSSVTLQAVAYALGVTNSAVSSAEYSINYGTGYYTLPPGVPIIVDGAEAGPIYVAIADLQRDLQKVLGRNSPVVNTNPLGPGIVVTCNGAATATYRDSTLTGYESQLLTAQGTPSAPRIVLQGADTRGTIYAIYEFSNDYLNVPPLWYWASWVPPAQSAIVVPTNLNTRIGTPAVRYRGIFPNDEDMLSPWLNASTNNYNALFESLLRSKYNVLDVDHISDVGGANAGLIWARTCMARGITVTYTHYAALGANIADYGSIVGGSPNATNVAGLQQFWTHYINLAATNGLTNLIQSIVFRGAGDQAWWTSIAGDPGTSQGRANVICQMMFTEMALLRNVTGNPHPLMKTVFYNEVADFMDNYNTPVGFSMNPPTDPDLIWCPSSDQRDHFPTQDVATYNYRNYRSGSNLFGYYFNFQFYTTGSHLVAGEGPWKAALNHQIANRQAGPGNFVCSILNAGNVREFTMELAAGGDMLWNLSSNYNTASFVQNFCARYFGSGNATQAAAVIASYYNGFWQQETPDTTTFTNGFPRQFIFQDLRYAQAAGYLLEDLEIRSYIANPFDAQGPRYFRVIASDNDASTELQAAINGTSAAITNFGPVVASAETIYSNLPSISQPYFNDVVRQPAHFMLEANLFLQGLAEADANIANGDATVHPWLVQARSACEGMQTALNNTTQGAVFGGWYGPEVDFNIPNLRNLVNNTILLYPSPAIQAASIAGSTLVFSGTGGSSSGVYYMVTSTNLALPLADWVLVATNSFDASGNFSSSLSFSTSDYQRYYAIKMP